MPKTITIDKIDAAPISKDSKTTWSDIFKQVNPLGHIAEAYARTLAYKQESKRLELEMERVKEQSSVIHAQINSIYNLSMEELKIRKAAVEQYFKTVQQQLGHLHIERMQVLKMAEMVNKQVLEAKTDSERVVLKDYALGIISTIPQFGDRANQALDVLVKSLPNPSNTIKLLGE